MMDKLIVLALIVWMFGAGFYVGRAWQIAADDPDRQRELSDDKAMAGALAGAAVVFWPVLVVAEVWWWLRDRRHAA